MTRNTREWPSDADSTPAKGPCELMSELRCGNKVDLSAEDVTVGLRAHVVPLVLLTCLG